MKIIKLLYIKYILSLLICLTSSFVIFFIFSLISYLNEDYLFNTIISISFINSFQILMYVPSFIFLISIILFTIFLKSQNEIIIIKSYLKTKRLFIFLLPIVFFFTVLEVNKKLIVEFLEDNKINLSENDTLMFSRILVEKDNFTKKFIVFNNVDLNNLQDAEYRLFEIINKKIYLAEFSNNILLSNNTLIAKNYTKYSDNIIEDFNIQKKIEINLNELIDQNTVVRDISKKSDFKFDIKIINMMLFFVLFFNFIFLIFFNRRYIGVKNSLIYPTLICLSFLIYSFFIFNNSLNFYNNEFEILASFIAGIFFLKVYINE